VAAPQRFVFVVLDGVGAGALPDAADYGDTGSDTLGNLSRVVRLHLPNFRRLGLGNIVPLAGVHPVQTPLCLPGRLASVSRGKDTTVGHWEHMGLITSRPFPTYPKGFPADVVGPFGAAIGRGILGNKPASGTTIIAELGQEHLATGEPIVYTSADSVFQIAAHVDVVPSEQLYEWCRIARGLLQGPHAVARVIARPFAGSEGAFVRTKDRRDFSLEPPGLTYLDLLQDAGVPVMALGKVSEVFVGRGVSATIKVAGNDDNLALLVDLLRGRSRKGTFDRGLLITNLVDFDMVWGHRNDAEGFAGGLEAVDAALPSLLASLGPDDRLILTADHGVDPTTPSTDHSREYVPLLLYPRPLGAPQAVYEGSFADTGATVFTYLTGEAATLAGVDIADRRPDRGWRHYTPVLRVAGAAPEWVPTRSGLAEAEEAARWLAQNRGTAPDYAVILGSGLEPDPLPPIVAEAPYEEIPHWVAGTVTGHPGRVSIVEWRGRRLALLRGRVHEYEGFDLGEVQLVVSALAVWGTCRLVITSASGAVDNTLAPGAVLVVGDILDCQYPDADGRPTRLRATDGALLIALGRTGSVHASVMGPQYETPAELAVLRTLGAHTVSMSPAAEVRAAHDCKMELAVLTVVANAGDTTHEEVLTATARTGRGLREAIEAVLGIWASPPSLDGKPG
jgi:phosphopentomutase